MRQVGIVGVGHTKFGKWEGTFLELITQAALQAMDLAQRDALSLSRLELPSGTGRPLGGAAA